MVDLKKRRKEMGIIGEKAAEMCGISRQYYNFIENGKRRPSVEVAKRIADVFGFEWTRFFEKEVG